MPSHPPRPEICLVRTFCTSGCLCRPPPYLGCKVSATCSEQGCRNLDLSACMTLPTSHLSRSETCQHRMGWGWLILPHRNYPRGREAGELSRVHSRHLPHNTPDTTRWIALRSRASSPQCPQRTHMENRPPARHGAFARDCFGPGPRSRSRVAPAASTQQQRRGRPGSIATGWR